MMVPEKDLGPLMDALEDVARKIYNQGYLAGEKGKGWEYDMDQYREDIYNIIENYV